MKDLIHIQHSFRTSTRTELVKKLRELVAEIQEDNTSCLSQRQTASALGVSESTWKRARGVGGEWRKVDIYCLLKFISLFPGKGKGSVILLTPTSSDRDLINRVLTELTPQSCPEYDQEALIQTFELQE